MISFERMNTYPTMYERVVNQLLSAESKLISMHLSFRDAVRRTLDGKELTGETSICEKIGESHGDRSCIELA